MHAHHAHVPARAIAGHARLPFVMTSCAFHHAEAGASVRDSLAALATRVGHERERRAAGADGNRMFGAGSREGARARKCSLIRHMRTAQGSHEFTGLHCSPRCTTQHRKKKEPPCSRSLASSGPTIEPFDFFVNFVSCADSQPSAVVFNHSRQIHLLGELMR